ncbi:MAG: two-component regulator propeller domain-containing protein, partial [Flavobacteriales bacterium]
MLAGLRLHGQPVWSVHRLTADNGLPQNTVRSMAFDAEGYLWICTEGGLVRFDGQRTRIFSTRTGADVGDDRMGHLLGMPHGALLLSDAIGHLYTLHPDGPRRVVDADTIANAGARVSGQVPRLSRYPAMLRLATHVPRLDLFAATYNQVLAFDERTWAIVGPHAVHVFDRDALVRQVPVRAAPRMDHMLQGALHIWSADGTCERLRKNAQRLEAVKVSGGPRHAPIERILFSPAPDQVFALSSDTLWQVLTEGDGIRLRPVLCGLPDGTSILSVCMSPDGTNLFLGTPDQGVYRYRREYGQRILLPDEAKGKRAFYAMVPLDSGQVLTRSGWTASPAGFRQGPLAALSYSDVAMHLDASGRFWAGDDAHLSVVDPRSGRLLRALEHKAGYPSAFLQRGDTTWVAGSKGLGWYLNDTLRGFIPLRVRDYRDQVYVMVMGPDGRIWVGTGRGVHTVDWQRGRLDELPWSKGEHVRAMHRWRGRMLLGTYGDGILVGDGSGVRRLTLDARGDATHVHAFAPDGLGWLWLPTNRGLFRIREDDLERHLEDGRFPLAYASHPIAEHDGTIEFNGGCSPAFALLENGQMVFPTMNGLVWLDPSQVPDPWPEGNVHVDAFHADGLPQHPVRAAGALSAGSTVELELSLPFWGHPRNFQLRYRLQGLGDAPLAVPSDGRIRFERLPAGRYALRIALPGSVDDQEVVRFQVRPPWFLRWWALLLAAVLLVALGQLIARGRVHRAQRQQAILQAKVDERTAELRDRNDALRREGEIRESLHRVLMHDIMAPIKAMDQVGRKATETLRDLSDVELRAIFKDMASASMQLHDTASQLLEWVKHQGGRLVIARQHLAMHDFVQGILRRLDSGASQQGVRLSNEVPEELIVRTDPSVLGIIVHNLVANAIKHAPGAEVRVGAEMDEAILRLAVRDTGPGLGPAALQRVHGLLNGGGRDAEHLRSGLGYMIIADMATL